ncbi:MAG: hypothetical protein AAGA26_12005 [Pseudomonadota bacterium]
MIGAILQSISALARRTVPELRAAGIGATITAFTIFSHVDTLISLSSKVRYLVSVWRDLIALPWTLLADLFDLEITKTSAGLLTVLCATALVVHSAWEETGAEMSRSFRTMAVVVCSAVGFVYSCLIIVPALYDASDPTFEVTSLAIEFLAQAYYTDVETVDEPSIAFLAGLTAVILFSYALLFLWPFLGSQSRKSRSRMAAGGALILLFVIFLADRTFGSFLPISLAGDDPLGTVLIFAAMGLILLGPFAGSVYLSDPATSARRNIGIAVIVVLLILLDRIAWAIETLGERLGQ